MFKIPKRCEYCAHKLVDDKCVNPACIAYKPEQQADEKRMVSLNDDKSNRAQRRWRRIPWY